MLHVENISHWLLFTILPAVPSPLIPVDLAAPTTLMHPQSTRCQQNWPLTIIYNWSMPILKPTEICLKYFILEKVVEYGWLSQQTTFAGQSYTLMLLSSDTDTTRLLSGLYLTPQTWSACSLNVYRHLRSATSHIFTVLSLDDDAKCLPSPDIDTLSTQEAWPDSVPATSECARQL